MVAKALEESAINTSCLAKNLSTLLQRQGVTESQLARGINLPYNTIRRLVDGVTTDPRLSTICEICSFLNVPLDVLTGNDANHNLLIKKISKPLSVPVFTWGQLSDPNFLNSVDLSIWPEWYPIPPISNDGLNDHIYAIETRASMQPRFQAGTILIIDPDTKPIDGDLVLVRILEDNAISLREIFIDPPTKKLMPIAQNSSCLTFESGKHKITGVVVLNMLMRNK